MTTTFESNRKSKVHRYENQPFFRSRKEAKRENAPFFNTVNPTNTPFFVQAKLEVGSPDSPAEMEADAVAEKVVQMPESSVNAKHEDASQSPTPLADTIARKGSGHTVPVSDKLAGDIRSAQGGGEHLDRSTREFMSSRFGADFSQVKVHTDATSVQMSSELNAHAFTVGNDVFFNRGKYNPTSRSGKRLLAHELTHVVQQNGINAGNSIQREEGGFECDSDDDACVEWKEYSKVHNYFHGDTEDEKFQDYKSLKDPYKNAGVDNPAKYISDNIKWIKFFDKGTPAHKDMEDKLKEAENKLKDKDLKPDLKTFWAFNPRKIANTNKLSNHSLGKAVDINSGDNPHITNKFILDIISKVTGTEILNKRGVQDLKAVNDDFKEKYADWKTEQENKRKKMEEIEEPTEMNKLEIKKLKELLEKIKNYDNTLNKYATNGFLNLENELVDELISAGFEWGGDWSKSKDFMHFEIS